jgi:hypothetical protein
MLRIALAALLVCAAGCAPQANRSSAPGVPANALAWSALANATYATQFSDSGLVRLSEGSSSDSASRVESALSRKYAVGDLGGDALPDAAVILMTSAGGSGEFSELYAVRNDHGTARPLGSILLGDRVRLDSIWIADHEIRVSYVTHAHDDPMCCPSLSVTRAFEVAGDSLVAAPLRVSGRYQVGREAETFRPCGSRAVYWVRGQTPLLQRLHSEYERVATPARGEVFAEVSATVLDPAGRGFPSQFDGVLNIAEVRLVRALVAGECGDSAATAQR